MSFKVAFEHVMDAMAFSTKKDLREFIEDYYQLKCDRTNIELMCKGCKSPHDLASQWAYIGPKTVEIPPPIKSLPPMNVKKTSDVNFNTPPSGSSSGSSSGSPSGSSSGSSSGSPSGSSSGSPSGSSSGSSSGSPSGSSSGSP